jgi:hypothetical protein
LRFALLDTKGRIRKRSTGGLALTRDLEHSWLEEEGRKAWVTGLILGTSPRTVMTDTEVPFPSWPGVDPAIYAFDIARDL